MKRRSWLLVMVAVLLALIPFGAVARGLDDNDGDLLLRIDGTVIVREGEELENVVVIDGDAIIDGTVESTLVVIGGNATISGKVEGDVIVARGTLNLLPSAQVKNVSTFDGTLLRAPGATVTGEITESAGFTMNWVQGVLSSIFWAGMTLVVLFAGLIFAAVGGRQLRDAAALVVKNPGGMLIGVALLWMIMPVLMVISLATLFGIPLGIGYFIFVMPAFWFIGYLVAGAAIGRLLLRRRGGDERRYLPVVLGLVVLQALTWIPWIGWLLAGLAGVLGSGALVVRAWQGWRGPDTDATPVLTPSSTTPQTA